MIEDKLDREERIRLECIAQAVTLSMSHPNKAPIKVIEDAAQFEAYIKNGSNNG